MRCRWTVEDSNEAEQRVHKKKIVNVVEREALCLLVLFGMFTPDQTRKGMAVEEFNPSTPRSD